MQEKRADVIIKKGIMMKNLKISIIGVSLVYTNTCSVQYICRGYIYGVLCLSNCLYFCRSFIQKETRKRKQRNAQP